MDKTRSAARTEVVEQADGEETADEEAFMQEALALIWAQEQQECGESSAAASARNPYGQQETLATEFTRDFWDCKIWSRDLTGALK